MTDKDQYTNNVNDEWCELDIDQWINTYIPSIVTIIYARVKYTAINITKHFIAISRNMYYIAKNNKR